MILDEQDREKTAHDVKNRCKLWAKAESLSAARFRRLLPPAWRLLLLNSLILLIICNSGETIRPHVDGILLIQSETVQFQKHRICERYHIGTNSSF